MLLFGGHILTFDADQNRKRRNFFSDVWLLDLVSRSNCAYPSGNCWHPAPQRHYHHNYAPNILSLAGQSLVEPQVILYSMQHCWSRPNTHKQHSHTTHPGVPLQVEWQWRQLPCDTSSSPAKRDMASLLHLGDGQLLLFGGRSEQGKALQDTWTYNIDRCGYVQLWLHTSVCACSMQSEQCQHTAYAGWLIMRSLAYPPMPNITG